MENVDPIRKPKAAPRTPSMIRRARTRDALIHEYIQKARNTKTDSEPTSPSSSSDAKSRPSREQKSPVTPLAESPAPWSPQQDPFAPSNLSPRSPREIAPFKQRALPREAPTPPRPTSPQSKKQEKQDAADQLPPLPKEIISTRGPETIPTPLAGQSQTQDVPQQDKPAEPKALPDVPRPQPEAVSQNLPVSPFQEQRPLPPQERVPLHQRLQQRPQRRKDKSTPPQPDFPPVRQQQSRIPPSYPPTGPGNRPRPPQNFPARPCDPQSRPLPPAAHVGGSQPRSNAPAASSRIPRRPAPLQTGAAYPPRAASRRDESTISPQGNVPSSKPASLQAYIPPTNTNPTPPSPTPQMTTVTGSQPLVVSGRRIPSHYAVAAPSIASIVEEPEGRNSQRPSVSSFGGTDILNAYFETSDEDEPTVTSVSSKDYGAEPGVAPSKKTEAFALSLQKPLSATNISQAQFSLPTPPRTAALPATKPEAEQTLNTTPKSITTSPPQTPQLTTSPASTTTPSITTPRLTTSSTLPPQTTKTSPIKRKLPSSPATKSHVESSSNGSPPSAFKTATVPIPPVPLSLQIRQAERETPALPLLQTSPQVHERQLDSPTPTVTIQNSPDMAEPARSPRDESTGRIGLVVPAPLISRPHGSPSPGGLNQTASFESVNTLRAKSSVDSFATARMLPSPSPQEQPLSPLQSRFSSSTKVSEEALDVLQPPLPLFAGGRSKSRTDLESSRTSVGVESSDLPPVDPARGSMTSLPGLISRALRLASNLERGKTSSKFGLDWMAANNSNPQLIAKHKSSTNSLTEMIESFPVTPGGSPRADRGQLPLSAWSNVGEKRHATRPSQRARGPFRPEQRAMSSLRYDQRAMSSLPSTPARSIDERKRKVCRLPLWLFVTIVIVLVVVVAVAVIIPVAVIVIPNQRKSGGTAQSECQKDHPCSHGGSVVVSSSGTCQCLCVNGWSGPTCTVQDMGGCVDVFVDGLNSTIGSSIPRLIAASQSSPQIRLNETLLLSTFSAADLSCASQNALVTFNGLSSRSPQSGSRYLRQIRQVQNPSSQYGIMIATWTSQPIPSTTINVPATTATPTATSTPVFDPNSATSLDFGRTSVLYILQTTASLTEAIAAQNDLQVFYTNPGSSDASNIMLGSGWIANLRGLSLTHTDS